MQTVLITGGTGVLGRQIAKQLKAQSLQARVMSRRPTADQVYGDLLSPQGLKQALEGVDVVIHAATEPRHGKTDIVMTRHLLQALQGQDIKHFIYISIVGVDQLSAFPYYAAKLESEHLIKTSGLPYTILRATQFFELIDYFLSRLRIGKIQLTSKDGLCQPIETAVVAQRLAELALAKPSFNPNELAGPQVFTFMELAQIAEQVREQKNVLVNIPLPIRALREGALTPRHPERLGITWEQWLQEHRGQPSAY